MPTWNVWRWKSAMPRSTSAERMKSPGTGPSIMGLCMSISHHLLGVVRPTLAEGVAREEPTDLGGRLVRMQVLQEMSRPDLVHRNEKQVVDAGDVRLLLGRAPRRVGRRDEVQRRQVLLVRAG